jgi:DNA polymerase III subunit epsilon
MYAIVDIETTGGSALANRITEIAIFLFDGEKVVDEFVSLVNPESYIPANITSLTGISNQMVANAPKFFEIARRVVEITEGATFVAHNVTFDYKFIQAEFKRLGFDYTRPTLCSVRLSRKFIPGHASYSLGAICGDLGISINGRHRAAGDAQATVQLFQRIIAIAPEVLTMGGGALKNLTSLVKPEIISNLPETAGVYYLYNANGDVIYIGKSINIRKRVLDHIGNPTTKRATEMLAQIADVGYEESGSELIALILEADAIKANLPKYNKKGRRKGSLFGIFNQVDLNGYENLAIKSISTNDENPISCFDSLSEAQSFLYRLVEGYELCQKLCGLYQSSNACFHHQIGQCKGACVGKESAIVYNARARKAIDSLGVGNMSFLVIDKGKSSDEKSFVKVINGKIEGYGYFNPEYIGNSTDLLTESVIPCGNHREALMAVRSFMGRRDVKIVEIPNEP